MTTTLDVKRYEVGYKTDLGEFCTAYIFRLDEDGDWVRAEDVGPAIESAKASQAQVEREFAEAIRRRLERELAEARAELAKALKADCQRDTP